jgi:hypothetical protein
MTKTIFIALLSLLTLFLVSSGWDHSLAGQNQKRSDGTTGTLEKMIVAQGSVTMDLNLNRSGAGRGRVKDAKPVSLQFAAERDSFFTAIVFNDELRGVLPSAMSLIPQSSAVLPAKLNASLGQLVLEHTQPGEPYELVVRDGKSGFVFFNIEGQHVEYNGSEDSLNVQAGRLLLSQEFAAELGRSGESGTVVGEINIKATMRAIEVTEIVDGETKSEVLPAMKDPEAGTVPGPDVVVGDLAGLAQFGSASGNQVGLAVGTDSCNFGTVDLNWFQNPSNDHPVIPQNLYRMSGGATNDERFEQIGQSQVKHAFTALTQNLCGLGCNGVGGSRLGSGCSDPYSASLNAGPNLGSRAWINPFTGFYPRGDSATPNNNHTGHTHLGPTHRILTNISDLSTTQNPGATYYAEAQYITPHEYAWCQQNPTQCNMYNNVSYRRYNVSGTTSPFSFSAAAATQRTKAAITAWTGANMSEFKPEPGIDGVGAIAWKVTNPSPGVWHYEYAIYNQNLDRAVQSFSVPVGNGVTLTNIGFHAPPQHPGMAADGTFNNLGFSSTPWAPTQANGALTWASETFAQNPNANAIRWGTMYNFRFDSNRPPENMNATIGFFKTGNPITVQVQGPSAQPVANVSISGRVLTSSGQGVGGISVALTDTGGNLVAFATTTSFGFYQFNNIIPGRTYTIEPITKRYAFEPWTGQITDNVVDRNFVAEPN